MPDIARDRPPAVPEGGPETAPAPAPEEFASRRSVPTLAAGGLVAAAGSAGDAYAVERGALSSGIGDADEPWRSGDRSATPHDSAWYRATWQQLQSHRDGVTVDASGLSPLLLALGKVAQGTLAETTR